MPDVIAPSRIPSGSCVGMKAIMIFQKRGRKGDSPRMPEASSTDVVRYVAQSARRPAMNPATAIFIFTARIALKVKYPAKEPTTPMETMSAPHVLKPPWARKSAWIRRAAAVISTLMAGPRSIPEIPVPQGCEHVPADGTGIGMQEMIKTTAAMRPTSGLNDRSAADIFFSRYNPKPTNGSATPNQRAAQLNGNIPSEMCMA